MLKLKDAVQVKSSRRVGDVQQLKGNRALVRLMGSQVKRWVAVSDLRPLDWLND